MAALRHGIKTWSSSRKANEKDLEEIDQTVRKGLNFMTAEPCGQRAGSGAGFLRLHRTGFGGSCKECTAAGCPAGRRSR